MGLLEIILIAVGLAMDAFAASAVLGLSVKKPNLKEIIIPSAYFGFFQTFMPIIGYFAGIYFANKIEESDHWIAFILLGFIGGKMVIDSLSKEKKEEKTDQNPFGHAKILILAVATSIDALIIGITFAFFNTNIYQAALIIGIVTFFISICGVIIGNMFGIKFKSKAEFIGGVVLIAIGVKIVIEHLFFQ
ncbi:MAG: manganese efflux pump MntP family protein [Campylobacteraceae bacterium]|nr:manganese efflux pump MntP family protein [Campylobacteraceae bacterium]